MSKKALSTAFFIVGLLMTACGSDTPPPTEELIPTETWTVEVPPTVTATATAAPHTETPTVEVSEPTRTPTAEASPTATHTATTAPPTNTPMPLCTPPACAENQVYYCPGECPGGCGTICATPTPETLVAEPTIISFTADPMEIVQGESTTFSWEATGGTEAWIEWTDNFAMLQATPIDPNGGTITLTPPNSPVALHVRNSAGGARATLDLTILCAHEWVPPLADNPPSSRCPFEAQYGPAAQQPFENGSMIWFGPGDVIYVYYNDAPAGAPRQYRTFEDLFQEGDPESDPDIVPPEGLFQPIRGFGLVWRTQPEVRERLGWATAPEAGFETWRQSYSEMAMHSYLTLMQGIDGTIYHLSATGATWVIYEP